MSIVKLENLHKHYQMGTQQVRAINGVSIEFAKGSFWAIMGPSGSGKSTMMNILGCLDRPTSGTYILESKNVSTLNDDKLSEIRLRYIGFIFQSFNLIPQLTVQKNIELPLYYLGWPSHKSSQRAQQLAEKVGLEKRLSHRPQELSGGQMQRVAVARALAAEPDIILADEPTGNLDSKTSNQIMNLLTELNREGVTIIMVTHEPDIAVYAGYRMHMRDGKIAQVETD